MLRNQKLKIWQATPSIAFFSSFHVCTSRLSYILKTQARLASIIFFPKCDVHKSKTFRLGASVKKIIKAGFEKVLFVYCSFSAKSELCTYIECTVSPYNVFRPRLGLYRWSADEGGRGHEAEGNRNELFRIGSDSDGKEQIRQQRIVWKYQQPVFPQNQNGEVKWP